MQLGPRIGNTNNFGILGAEGFFEIYASYRNLDDIHVTKSHFMKFLSAWQTEDYPFYYEPRPLSSFSFELPYGVDAIDIQIRATINAHSNIGNENLEAADNSAIHYSLVDFRSKYDPLDPTPNQPSDYHIISQIVDNVDHTPPGAIEIETISVSTYKIYQNRPDLN
jgi:hypothetical protein